MLCELSPHPLSASLLFNFEHRTEAKLIKDFIYRGKYLFRKCLWVLKTWEEEFTRESTGFFPCLGNLALDFSKDLKRNSKVSF